MKEYPYPRLDETVCRTRLSNGLTVQVVPRKGFTKKLAYFVTDYGAVHTHFALEGREYRVPAGVAHYLEHKMFDMPDGRDISAEFAGLGAMVNAFTSYDLTAYYFSCTEHFSECLRLLLEFVSTPYFTPETVEKERGIIDQEIGMCHDAPDNRMFENLMASTFAHHPIRVPILGTGQTIRQITPEILHLCHRAFYAPGNMMLCVIGDVNPEEVEATALDVLGTACRPIAQKIQNWQEPVFAATGLVEQNMEVAMPMFSLAFKCEPVPDGEEGVLEEITADLAAEALFGESSQLYLRLYEQGIIDSSFGGGFEAMDGCAMLLISGDSDYPDRVRTELIEEAARLARQGIPEESFRRMKRSALGRRIRELDSFDSTCFRLCAYHYSGYDYFSFPEVYEKIESRHLQEFLARVVTRERSSLSVIYPVDSNE